MTSAPMDQPTGNMFKPGQVILTVHKANNVEKKGMMGKADPYVVLKYANQKEQSPTVNNDQNPVWNFTALFDIDKPENEITIELFDEDIGKDDFLGKAMVDVKSIIEVEWTNKQIALEDCKSGDIIISAKFVQLQEL